MSLLEVKTERAKLIEIALKIKFYLMNILQTKRASINKTQSHGGKILMIN